MAPARPRKLKPSETAEGHAALADIGHTPSPVFIDAEDHGPRAVLIATCADCGLPLYKAPNAGWRHRRKRTAAPGRPRDEVPGQGALF